MQIRSIIKSFYSTDEIQSLANNLLQESESLTPSSAVVTALSESLSASYESLKAARGYSKVNTQTLQVAGADEDRDLAFRAFYTYVQAWSLRQNNEHQQAAQNIMIRLGKTDRQLPYMGYSGQSAELVLLFNEMSHVETELVAIGADAWLDELKATEDKFKAKQKGKLEEEVEKKALVLTKEAKEKTLAQIVALVQTLNGLEMAGIEGISELNKRIDQVIAEIEIPARARHSRRSTVVAEE